MSYEWMAGLERVRPEDERAVVEAAKNGCIESRNRLVLSIVPLILTFAKNCGSHRVPVDDLFSEGVIGAMNAIKTYRPEMAVWITYGSRGASLAMSNALRRKYKDRQEVRLSNEYRRELARQTRIDYDVSAVAGFVQEVISSLNEREAFVIRGHLEGKTLVESGEQLGLSKQMASHIKMTAYRKLLKECRDALRDQGFEDDEPESLLCQVNELLREKAGAA